MGTGTKPYIFLKPIYAWVLAILIAATSNGASEAYVNTQLRNFSKPEPIIQKPSYKAPEIYHEPLPDPGDAVLWQAPPYKLLASKLKRSEEEQRYKQALNILIGAAFQNDAQLNAARDKLKRSQLTKLSVDLIQQLSNYELKTSSESETYIRTAISEITKQFKIYSVSYFQSSRDPVWQQQIESDAAYLGYHCSQAALEEASKLYLQ